MKHLPDDVCNKKIKVIIVLRNPKDVAVSFYNFLETLPYVNYKGEWKNLVRPFFLRKYFDDTAEILLTVITNQTSNLDVPISEKKHFVEAVDDGGDTITFLNDNGFLLPYFPDGIGIDGVRSLRIRDDDILICTYPKSGTHWVFEITRELLTGEITDDKITKVEAFMERISQEKCAALQSPRILNSHLLMEHLPEDVRNKKIKVIIVHRNPKDVAVSFHSFLRGIPEANYKGEWKNFVRPFFRGKFMYGSWMDYVLDWEKAKKDNPDLPVLNLFYEDIKEDQMREMRRICEFLSVERTDDFLSRVCDNTSIAAMRTLKKKDDSGITFFRKGGVGDWKNWFTVAQNEWCDQLYQEKMGDCPLQFKYTL